MVRREFASNIDGVCAVDGLLTVRNRILKLKTKPHPKWLNFLVRAVGVEPTRRCHRGILSPLRLPVPPRPLYSGDQLLSAFIGEVE